MLFYYIYLGEGGGGGGGEMEKNRGPSGNFAGQATKTSIYICWFFFFFCGAFYFSFIFNLVCTRTPQRQKNVCNSTLFIRVRKPVVTRGIKPLKEQNNLDGVEPFVPLFSGPATNKP